MKNQIDLIYNYAQDKIFSKEAAEILGLAQESMSVLRDYCFIFPKGEKASKFVYHSRQEILTFKKNHDVKKELSKAWSLKKQADKHEYTEEDLPSSTLDCRLAQNFIRLACAPFRAFKNRDQYKDFLESEKLAASNAFRLRTGL